MKNVIVPSYRVAPPGELATQLAFRCSWCGRVHAHGVGSGLPVQWRAADQCVPPTEITGHQYILLACGDVTSRRMLPRLSLDDLKKFNAARASPASPLLKGSTQNV